MNKLIILFILLPTLLYAQQKEIWFYDGTIKAAQKVSYDSTTVAFINWKGKTKYEDIEDVFAIVSPKDTTFFYEDTGKISTLYQMVNYIRGKQDGLKYKNIWIFSGGLLSGITAPFILAAIGLPISPAPVISLGYVIIVSAITPKNIDIPTEYKSNKFYKTGKITGIKKRRTLIAIYGSIIGLFIGLITAYFILEYKK